MTRTPMKLNSTVALTLILLSLMVGAGVVSAAWGIALGRDALKGVTQPDTRPSNNMAKRQGVSRREEFTILREEDIISNARARIHGTAKTNAPIKKDTVAANPAAANQGKFPIVSQSENIVMTVNSAKKQGEMLVVQVNLRNNSDRTVQFLYDNLSVTDEQGRELTANTDGLPSDLPAASNNFAGTIAIPVSILEDAKKISLLLTDYPDEQIELKISDIPVPQ